MRTSPLSLKRRSAGSAVPLFLPKGLFARTVIRFPLTQEYAPFYSFHFDGVLRGDLTARPSAVLHLPTALCGTVAPSLLFIAYINNKPFSKFCQYRIRTNSANRRTRFCSLFTTNCHRRAKFGSSPHRRRLLPKAIISHARARPISPFCATRDRRTQAPPQASERQDGPR